MTAPRPGYDALAYPTRWLVVIFLGAVAALLYNLSVRFTGGLLVGFQNS